MNPLLTNPLASPLLSLFPTVISLLILGWLLSSLYSTFFGPLSKFPGPKLWAFSRIPLVYTTIQGEDPRAIIALHRKYGPVVRVGPNQLSYAGGAADWKAIYGFRKPGFVPPHKDRVFYQPALNNAPNVINADDAVHSRQRRVLANAFSDKALKEQEPLLKKWADLLRTKLGEKANGVTKVDMVSYWNFTTFDIMADLTFSEGLEMLKGSQYSPWVRKIFGGIKRNTLFRALRDNDPVSKLFIEKVLFSTKAARQAMWDHQNYTDERVHRRMARTPEQPDLWSVVIARSKEDPSFTLAEHESNASVFMIAGTETTATALSGVLYNLLRNPKVMQRLIDEIRSTYTTFDDITLENVAHLKYLQAVLQEGLRMYPPVPIAMPRQVSEGGTEINGMYVPVGTRLGVHQYSTYHLEEHFKNPDEYHPERWLGDPEYKDDHRDAVEPFSVGPRNCLGKNLAWNEMRLLLSGVLLDYDVKLAPESNNWLYQKVFTLWEKKPLYCTLTPVQKATPRVETVSA